MEENKQTIFDKGDGMNDNQRIHQMLVKVYEKEEVPDDVNVRLKNRLVCMEAMQDQNISFWWLPAMLSTVIALSGLVVCVLIYLIISMRSTAFIMPNLVHLISTGWLHIVYFVTVCQIGISWIFTIIGLCKLNLRKRAHIL